MRRIALMLVALSALSACNTLEGFGEDVSNTARAIDRQF